MGGGGGRPALHVTPSVQLTTSISHYFHHYLFLLQKFILLFILSVFFWKEPREGGRGVSQSLRGSRELSTPRSARLRCDRERREVLSRSPPGRAQPADNLTNFFQTCSTFSSPLCSFSARPQRHHRNKSRESSVERGLDTHWTRTGTPCLTGTPT